MFRIFHRFYAMKIHTNLARIEIVTLKYLSNQIRYLRGLHKKQKAR